MGWNSSPSGDVRNPSEIQMNLDWTHSTCSTSDGGTFPIGVLISISETSFTAAGGGDEGVEPGVRYVIFARASRVSYQLAVI
jgi:hypothetical protein